LALFVWFFKEFIRLYPAEMRLQFFGFDFSSPRLLCNSIKLTKLSDLLELRYECTPAVGQHTKALRLYSGRLKEALWQPLLRFRQQDDSGTKCYVDVKISIYITGPRQTFPNCSSNRSNWNLYSWQ